MLYPNQNWLTYKHRKLVVNWMLEVADTGNMQEETIHLAVDCLDRYLKTEKVNEVNLQLTGAACLVIAMKYCEGQCYSFNWMVWMSGEAFSKSELVDCERKVLYKLDFRLNRYTIWNGLNKLTATLSHAEFASSCLEIAYQISRKCLLEGQQINIWPNLELSATIIFLASKSVRSWAPLNKIQEYDLVNVQHIITALKTAL